MMTESYHAIRSSSLWESYKITCMTIGTQYIDALKSFDDLHKQAR
jgi:hypothetical protein